MAPILSRRNINSFHFGGNVFWKWGLIVDFVERELREALDSKGKPLLWVMMVKAELAPERSIKTPCAFSAIQMKTRLFFSLCILIGGEGSDDTLKWAS